MLMVSSHVKKDWVEKYRTLARNAIVAIGGGSLIDRAKIVAVQSGQPLVVIPTGLTTDTAFTGTSAYRPEPGVVRYDTTKKPDVVVFDSDILEKAPERFRYAGWAEVFSIVTAYYRWRKMDSFNLDLAARAKALVDDAKADSFKSLFESLKEEVHLCKLAGTDALEEGVEHFVAYRLEKFAPNCLHSELLFVTIPMVASRYGLEAQEIKSRLECLGAFGLSFGAFARLEGKAKLILDEEFAHEFE